MRSKTTSSLHEAMHRIPGVPPHREPGAREIEGANRPHQHQHQHQHQHNHQLKQPTSLHDSPPRVLVAWQNKIGDIFRGKP